MRDGGGSDGLAPVIPLFDGEADRHAGRSVIGDESDGAALDEGRIAAERDLTRKLSARSLSVREARTVLAQRDLSPAAIDAVVDDFVRRGYLDDAALADQLVQSGTQRKGQGRRALAQALAGRGIPRDVADAAITELPDDDAERALAFARTKAAAMQRLPRDAALRRLVGQLSRRGYGGSVAMTAAREALAEAASGL